MITSEAKFGFIAVWGDFRSEHVKNSLREKSGVVVEMFPVCIEKMVTCVSAV